jgi:hypothetical protein
MKLNDRFASPSQKTIKIPTDFFLPKLRNDCEQNRDFEKNAQFLQEKCVKKKLNKNNFMTCQCHKIVTIRVKAVLTLAVPVMPS